FRCHRNCFVRKIMWCILFVLFVFLSITYFSSVVFPSVGSLTSEGWEDEDIPFKAECFNVSHPLHNFWLWITIYSHRLKEEASQILAEQVIGCDLCIGFHQSLEQSFVMTVSVFTSLISGASQFRTQEHPDAITPQGPRSTRTPLHHKSPPGTQEHPDAIGLEGPRSTQTPLDQEDPGVTKRYWTKRTQMYPKHHWTRRSQKYP
ncbi:hypothetical protein STEG23_025397, partial [Scotinomys teguina]